MMKTLTACTTQIDDVNAAVSEILEQLDLPNSLKKNSIGFITCYPEFIDAGIVKMLSDKLPFDTLGITTFACSTPGKIGQVMLIVSVLTSDDIIFSSSVTNPLNAGNLKSEIEKAYKSAASKLPGKASMIAVMSPFTFDFSGDDTLRELDAVTGGIPVFGSNAIDDNPDYKNAKAFYNGIENPATLSMALFYGDMKPSFSLGNVSDRNILPQKAVITSSKGNIIETINNIPAMDYMRSLGLAPEGQMISFANVPLIVDFNDGTQPASRVIIGVTPEKHIICAASMPQGTTLSVGSMNEEEVLRVSLQMFENTAARKNKNGAFIFSCLARNSALGLDAQAEMEAMQKTLNGKIPFFMGYSGGEFCPVQAPDGKMINRFHNNTIIICQF